MGEGRFRFPDSSGRLSASVATAGIVLCGAGAVAGAGVRQLPPLTASGSEEFLYPLLCLSVVQGITIVLLWLVLRGERRRALALRQAQQQEQELREREQARAEAEAEKAREKDRLMLQQSRFAAMGEMIGNIAHQWRQPLNMLGLLIQQMQMEQEKGTMTDQLMEQRVQKGMELILTLSRTIDNFRSFFRPQLQPALFRPAQVVDRTVAFFRPGCENNNISITVEGSSEQVLNGHANEFSQAVLNILDNARDALLDNGRRESWIRVRIGEEGSRSVVTISDNAGGIDESILHKVFDPYFTTKEEGKGTGVGLYLAKSIISRNMKGELTVRNLPEGAEFTIIV